MVWALVERADARDAEARAVGAQRTAEAASAQDRQRAASTRRLYQLLVGFIERATPALHGGDPPTMEQLLESLSAHGDEWAGGDPHVRGLLHLFLSRAMSARDDHVRAVAHWQRSREQLLQSPLTSEVERWMLVVREAALAQEAGRFDEAWSLLEPGREAVRVLGDPELVSVYTRQMVASLVAGNRQLETALAWLDELAVAPDPSLGDDLEHIRVQGMRARVLQRLGRNEESLAASAEVIEKLRRGWPESALLGESLSDRGHLLHLAQRTAEARPMLEEAVGILREAYPSAASRGLGRALDNLAVVERSEGRNERALLLLEEAAQQLRRIGAVGRQDLAISLDERGLTLLELGRLDEARSVLLEALDVHRESGSRGGPALASTLERLAFAELRLGELDAAESHAEEARQVRVRVHGEDHHLVARPLEVLGGLAHAREDLAAMERIGREAMRLRRAHYGEEHWTTWSDAWLIWVPLARRGEIDEARTVCGAARTCFRDQLGADSAKHLMALGHLAQLEELAGNSAEAARLREEHAGITARVR